MTRQRGATAPMMRSFITRWDLESLPRGWRNYPVSWISIIADVPTPLWAGWHCWRSFGLSRSTRMLPCLQKVLPMFENTTREALPPYGFCVPYCVKIMYRFLGINMEEMHLSKKPKVFYGYGYWWLAANRVNARQHYLWIRFLRGYLRCANP